MKTAMMIRREGYWANDKDSALPLPMPVKKPWAGKTKFLSALTKKESNDDTNQRHYKGWSTCRLCGCKNGSSDYHAGGWQWPDGMRHYVADHNVRPSLAFEEFVLGYQVDTPPKPKQKMKLKRVYLVSLTGKEVEPYFGRRQAIDRAWVRIKKATGAKEFCEHKRLSNESLHLSHGKGSRQIDAVVEYMDVKVTP